jgi:aryl-alcohol dehydrogenase-like predicted oxidoreductase
VKRPGPPWTFSGSEWELLPVCRAADIGVLTWSPLQSGWLSGAYHRGLAAPPADSKVGSVPGKLTTVSEPERVPYMYRSVPLPGRPRPTGRRGAPDAR